MKRSLITLAVLISIAALAAWRLRATHSAAPLVLAVVKPIVGDLKTSVTATGTLYPSHSVDIKYDGQEIVENLKVKEGDHVSAGQIVAVMDTRVLQHARLQNQQAAEKDTATLLQAEAAFHREEALFREGIVARADYEVTRATYQGLVHQRQADGEGVKATVQQMERAVLRSPMNGTVVSVYVHAGEMLGSATAVAALGPNTAISKPTNVLMTVVEDGPLEVYAGINAADLGSLAKDQEAEISIDAFQPAIFHGTVQRISLEPVVVNNVTTYQAIVTLTERDPRFRIGLPADVMLFTKLAGKSEIVPLKTILAGGHGDAVCAIQHASSASDEQPLDVEPVLVPVTVIAKTPDAVALDRKLPSNTLVFEDPTVCQRKFAANSSLQVEPFDFAPSFASASLAKSKQNQAITNLPPPKPKSWIQSVLGL